MKRQSQSLKSAIAKFDECAREDKAIDITRAELRAFIRYAREVEYDLETGMVNLMAQNYGADNCEENHDATGGVCKCWTGMTMDDFTGENPKDVDIAEWWGPFQFWNNSETPTIDRLKSAAIPTIPAATIAIASPAACTAELLDARYPQTCISANKPESEYCESCRTIVALHAEYFRRVRAREDAGTN